MKNMIGFILIAISWSVIYSQNCFDPANVYSFEYEGIRYEIVKENKTWLAAAECADEMGGILAEINSQEEQDTIFHFLNEAGIVVENTIAPDGGNASYVWIGGNDFEEEGKWIWDGSNDGVGTQFWEGTFSGNAVGDLYNNWGNEPDNFSNQDGLGLAITNWPFGKAGEWNDVNFYNELYFVIEYDFSTIKLSKIEYSYTEKAIYISAPHDFDYDSVQVHIDDSIHTTLFDITKEDSILISGYTASDSKIIKIRIYAYWEDKTAVSREFPLEIFTINDPVTFYSTDFEENPMDDFIGENFEITKPFGFATNSVHSPHDYDTDMEYTFTLIRPVIVGEVNPLMTYSDVAILEPGNEGSEFGDVEFNDYIVVEGSKTLGDWAALADGYDAGLYPEWKEAWDSGGLYRDLYRRHTIDLTDTFNPADTILIRFRLFSNSEITGWGWTMDSLLIQDIPFGIEEDGDPLNTFSLEQNYPNPFNPATTIKYEIPNIANVKLIIYDILGREIQILVNGHQNPGVYEIIFDAGKLPSGVYFYRLEAGAFFNTKRMMLIR